MRTSKKAAQARTRKLQKKAAKSKARRAEKKAEKKQAVTCTPSGCGEFLAILTPLDVEKWAVFSSKMLRAPTSPNACQRDHRVTRLILSQIPGINVKGTIASFKKLGGHCDCEVVLNAMRRLEREFCGTSNDIFFGKVLGEKFDPNSPKWKELLGPTTCLCNDCHEKLEAELRTVKKLAG